MIVVSSINVFVVAAILDRFELLRTSHCCIHVIQVYGRQNQVFKICITYFLCFNKSVIPTFCFARSLINLHFHFV